MEPRFVHLHTHSHYSLLNALPKIPDLVEAAKKDGQPALALTDSGNMYAAIEFYKECKKQGIKPILGVDGYLAARTRWDKEPSVDQRRSRLVLLAKDETGYRNLIKLTSAAHLEGFYEKPRMDRDILKEWHDGLIAIIPSFSGETSGALRQKDFSRAIETLAWYQKIFGPENVFLEITHHPEFEGHDALTKNTIAFAKENGANLVAAHDVYYLSRSDREARHAMQRIQNSADQGANEKDEDFSFITQDQAARFFKHVPEALSNTVKIADMCNLELTLGTWVFPNLKVESGKTYEEELRDLAEKGLEEKGLRGDVITEERLEYELTIINKKGFAPYLLIVGDLLRFAKENGILTNIRGSIAGSLVTYLIGITKVNPIEYKLPFERFLNPERPSAPDIDMDYADNRRDEMIAYVKVKYGDDHVAQVGTFGTMMARAAVRDTARALGYSYNTGDRLAKMIPMGSQGFPMTIERALELEPDFKKAYKTDDDAREIVDLAKKIEGCARHISVHAAGVVISPTPLTDFVPLQFDPKGGKTITQYDMYAVEEAGLLKFDFLGIRNLAILADSVRLVKERHGIEVDIENIPLDDQKTFDLLSRGETEGLFQLNGAGMTRFLKELRPTTIHDINAMVALYRPGPMEVIPQYIERKRDPRLISYPDPRMKKYLEESYGLIVYQDDLLFSAIELAGYSWLEADKFRKAVGKKIPEEMAAQKEKLMDGIIKNGQTKDFAERLWKLFEPFQAYGFNKAHAASYGKVAYQTAYMKANFPVEYMTAVLTAESGDIDKVAEIIAECKRMNILVLPPDLNESFSDFTIIDIDGVGGIRFGLSSIKNFGEGISEFIIKEREVNGPFASLPDFLSRIDSRNLNKKSLESLIKCGALDRYLERGHMLSNIDTLLEYHKEASRSTEHQDSLFGAIASGPSPLTLTPSPEASSKDRLAWEKELLGIYVSGHPLDTYAEILKKRDSIKKMKEETHAGVQIVVAGIIEEAKVLLTKNGEKMAFLKVADFSDFIEAVIFPKIYKDHSTSLVAESCVALKGKFSKRNGTLSMIVEAVKQL
jgi:DNA polymerase-3 subunit alpha